MYLKKSLAIFFCVSLIGTADAKSLFEPSTIIGSEKHTAFDVFIKDLELLSPKSVQFHPSGKYFYIEALESGKTICYDAETLYKKWSIAHSFDIKDSIINKVLEQQNKNIWMGEPSEATISKNGDYLFVVNYAKGFEREGFVNAIELKSKKSISVMPTLQTPKTTAISNDQKMLLTVNAGDNSVAFWSIENPTKPYLINRFYLGDKNGYNLDLRGAIFTPNDKYALISGTKSNGEIYIVSPQRGFIKAFRAPFEQIRDIVSSKKFRTYYFSTTTDQEVCSVSHVAIEEIISGEEPSSKAARCKKLNSPLRTIDINDKLGIGVATLYSSCEIAFFDLKTLEITQRLPAPCNPIGAAFAPDGESLVVSSVYGENGLGGDKIAIYKLINHENIQSEIPSKIDADSFEKIVIIVDSSKNKMYVKGIKDGKEERLREYKVSTARSNVKKPLGEGGVTAISLNPSWYPQSDTIRYFKKTKGINLPSAVPPGHPQNYMGLAKINLTHTVNGKGAYRIHGTLNEKTIGTKESAGCIRMKNKEVVELANILNGFSRLKSLKDISVILK